MHLIDAERHFMGGYAIVGGHLPLAVGLGFAVRYRKEDRVVICFFGDGAVPSGQTHEAFNLAERFIQHGESYFRFITTPGIEPTNNSAEQAIRFVAIDRRITQGTRGKAGQTWCERIWTAVATCERQGRSLFNFLCESVMAYFQGTTAPTLMHDTS